MQVCNKTKLRENPKAVDLQNNEKSMCNVCNEYKTCENFYVHKNGKLYKRCKECEIARCMEYKERTKYKRSQRRSEVRAEVRNALTKVCSSCNINKSSSEFETRRNQCNECRTAYLKKYHEQEHVKKRVNEKFKQLKQNNPQALLKSRLRARLWGLFKSCGTTKSVCTIDLVGCTWDQLQSHIEKQFKDDLNWEHPELSIDHIVLCDCFDLTDVLDQKRCFHYSNLQPMKLSDNIRKGNKLLSEHAQLYKNLKAMFCTS